MPAAIARRALVPVLGGPTLAPGEGTWSDLMRIYPKPLPSLARNRGAVPAVRGARALLR